MNAWKAVEISRPREKVTETEENTRAVGTSAPFTVPLGNLQNLKA
jgi:hypothetical protein